MSSSIIQSYYKRNDLNHVEELIMRVTNYAWSEMTLTQQGELREKAAAELAAMQARIEKLAEYPERLRKAITELEAMAASPAFTEKARILAKIEGVKLALGYFEEMTR